MRAKEEVGLEGVDRFDMLFKLWAKICDERIGITEDSLCVNVHIAEVERCNIELPCDVVAVYPALFVGELDCTDCVSFAYAFQNQFGHDLINILGFKSIYLQGNSYSCLFNEFQIVDNKIILPNNTYNGKKISLICLSRRKDDEGYIYTHPEYIQAMVEYITWRYAKRTRFTSVPRRFTRYEINDMEAEYHKQVRNARAEAFKASPAGERRMADLINNAFSGTTHTNWKFNVISDM